MRTAMYLAGFVVGLLVIIKGGDVFVDAAKWISKKLKIPTFIVGATIVSIATTLPEILVSCIAAGEGSTDLAIGNAVGSVTANTGLIMGISLLFMAPTVKRKEIAIRGGLLLTTITALWLMSLAGANKYFLTILESILLFVLFVLFICENIHAARTGEIEIDVDDEKSKPVKNETLINIVKFVLGIAGLALGSNLLVDCSKYMAIELLHISEAVVGLTIVAIGTSLPEAVTAITSIIKKEGTMSIGNIIGANIIDTALILPLCAIISGGAIPVSARGVMIDMPVCLALAAIAVLPTIIQGRFMKYQGIIMLLGYIAYVAYMVAAIA